MKLFFQSEFQKTLITLNAFKCEKDLRGSGPKIIRGSLFYCSEEKNKWKLRFAKTLSDPSNLLICVQFNSRNKWKVENVFAHHSESHFSSLTCPRRSLWSKNLVRSPLLVFYKDSVITYIYIWMTFDLS